MNRVNLKKKNNPNASGGPGWDFSIITPPRSTGPHYY
jgi:hypothetical protein